MFKKSYYRPAELLALQELDDVMKALKLSDEDVIEMLLDDLRPFQEKMVSDWYDRFLEDCELAATDHKYEESI